MRCVATLAHVILIRTSRRTLAALRQTTALTPPVLRSAPRTHTASPASETKSKVQRRGAFREVGAGSLRPPSGVLRWGRGSQSFRLSLYPLFHWASLSLFLPLLASPSSSSVSLSSSLYIYLCLSLSHFFFLFTRATQVSQGRDRKGTK